MPDTPLVALRASMELPPAAAEARLAPDANGDHREERLDAAAGERGVDGVDQVAGLEGLLEVPDRAQLVVSVIVLGGSRRRR